MKSTLYSPETDPFRDKKLFPFELQSAYPDFLYVGTCFLLSCECEVSNVVGFHGEFFFFSRL